MKIALAFPRCNRRGGVERVNVECAGFLASRGHNVHVYASEYDENVLPVNVFRHHVPGLPLPLIQVASFAGRALREVRRSEVHPDVIGSFGVESPPGSVTWVQSVQRAWLEASRTYRKWPARMRQRINPFHPLILLLERNYYQNRRYRKLIALTNDVKSDLMRFYGVPSEDIIIIPNGFASREFNRDRTVEARPEMRRRLGYTNDHRVIVFAANELDRKGFGPLICAIGGLRNQNVKLLVVGRVDVGAYAADIRQLGLTDRVQFVGGSQDVARYYAASDIFALPTRYEAWGLVIVEAMACGLPVLTSRLAGAAVAVREGRSGFLLDDPGDVEEIEMKLRWLLDGRHEAADVVAASVSQYSWDTVLLRYEEVLRQCAGSFT